MKKKTSVSQIKQKKNIGLGKKVERTYAMGKNWKPCSGHTKEGETKIKL